MTNPRDGDFYLATSGDHHLAIDSYLEACLEQVECWFAELTNRKLRHSAHRSMTELEVGILK